jgi:hypothetical protein
METNKGRAGVIVHAGAKSEQHPGCQAVMPKQVCGGGGQLWHMCVYKL